MRNAAKVLSLTEQIFASGFTFLLFIVAPRLLTGSELDLYSAIFSVNQSFAVFLFGLVLLPMSSASGEDADRQLGISLVLLAVLLLAFAAAVPLVVRAFASLDGRLDAGLWGLTAGFFAAQCGYEAARWLCIRLRGVRQALTVTFLRLGLFQATIFGIGAGGHDAYSFALAQIGINVLAVFGYGLVIGRQIGAVRLAFPSGLAFKHLATFGNSVGTFLTNFAVVALIDRGLGGSGLAAFQAVRSATNPIGLISQVLDNHYSAELARTGRRPKRKAKGMNVALIAAGLLMGAATAFGPQITSILFAGKFDTHWLLLPILLLASLSHALTRPIFVGWRIDGDTRALNQYSAALLVVAFPMLLLTGLNGLTYTMICLFACLPVAAIAIHLMRRRAEAAGDCA